MISFSAFLRALDLPEPYDWQRAFAERCAAGDPPTVVGVPTGSGKTTAVEALVWALAMQADRAAAERTVGVRTVWAIDRRILVDEVHERASRLAERLASALDDRSDALHETAVRLLRLGGGERPLIATRWRGGIDDPRELLGPQQPQIITSTVAQIGSRLLFRGYGVGPGSLALEAGLAACDTTICLDEAHLAGPFKQTVAAVAELRAAAPAAPALPALRLIALTATPDDEEPDVIGLSDADRRQLGDRYTGEKLAQLADAGDRANERARVDLLVERTLAHVADGADSVACVANTVRRARAVFERLEKSGLDDVDVCLLIGPQRAVDRDNLLRRHRRKLFERSTGGRRLVCVATQTFEVGLDADVEAMVTESASTQALVQRLGRLNRRGRRRGRATIVRDPEPWLYGEDESRAWEWLRGAREGEEIDVSVAALELSARSDGWPAPPEGDYAPSLTSDVVAQLAATAPRPGTFQEPDVEPFLSGVRARPSADLTVCWRTDLRPGQVGEDADEYRELLLAAVPPQPREQITLSVPAARALIVARCLRDRGRNQAARLAQEDADVDVEPPTGRLPEVPAEEDRVPFVAIHRGDVLRGTLAADPVDGAIRPRDLEPGDVVVLPTDAGGCDEFGLSPASAGPAADVAADVLDGDAVAVAPVRITPEALRDVLGAAWKPGVWRTVARRCHKADRALTRARSGGARRNEISSLIEDLHRDIGRLSRRHPGLARLRAALNANEVSIALETIGEQSVEVWDAELDADELAAGAEDATTSGDVGREAAVDEDDAEQPDPADPARQIETAWVLVPKPIRHRDERERSRGEEGGPPTLAEHAVAVHDRVAAELERLQLPAGVRDALLLAARAHDHGKADPRFQAFLYRGIRPVGAPAIAKSEFGTRDRATATRAARAAGLPVGFAHEGASVAVLEQALAEDGGAQGADLDLAVIAVGTHHERARPLPRIPSTSAGTTPPEPFHVDVAGIAGTACGDGAEAFCDGRWLQRLSVANRRYGPWGLAYLVGLLMLADRAVSAEGS